jgi:hypothetical protein
VKYAFRSILAYALAMCVGSVAPISLSSILWTNGVLRTGPMTGRLRKMLSTIGKKLLRGTERTGYSGIRSQRSTVKEGTKLMDKNIRHWRMSLLVWRPFFSDMSRGVLRSATDPNRLNIPKISMHIPTTGHPASTMTIPPRKHAVPRHLDRREKKTRVLRAPIRSVMPERKSNCGERGKEARREQSCQ